VTTESWSLPIYARSVSLHAEALAKRVRQRQRQPIFRTKGVQIWLRTTWIQGGLIQVPHCVKCQVAHNLLLSRDTRMVRSTYLRDSRVLAWHLRGSSGLRRWLIVYCNCSRVIAPPYIVSSMTSSSQGPASLPRTWSGYSRYDEGCCERQGRWRKVRGRSR
jgi:hypothetical protein